MKNPTTVFPPYRPQETSVAILAQAHAVVIDELLDAVLDLYRLDLAFMQGAIAERDPRHFAAWLRHEKAREAYYFVARECESCVG